VTYLKFATHLYPKMNLVPRYDDPRPKTIKFTGRTRKRLQTDGQTTPYHNRSRQRWVIKRTRAHDKINIITTKEI